jgi:protein-serine/threonine kinase
VPDARLACLNVLKSSLLTIDNSLDESGHSIHVHRLVQLKDWGRTLDLAPDRVSYHVLEALDAGAAILEYVNANRVDHIVLGARTDSRFRNILGSVSAAIVQKAPCTVTVVRRPRGHIAEATETAA